MAAQGGGDSSQSAFCAHFPGSPIDEIQFARQVTDMHGYGLQEVEIDPLKCWSDIDHYLYLMEDPYLTTPIPMILTYGAMRAGGVVVTIDGHGADELLCGYGPDIFEALPEAGIRGATELSQTYANLSVTSSDGQFKKMSPEWALVRHGLKRVIKRLVRATPYGSRLPEWSDGFNRHLYDLFIGTVLPTLLRNYDRYSMINGVEIRMPFMDHRLVELTFGLPWHYKLAGGYTKKILRDAVAPYMPEQICWRKSKVGFNSPMVDWLRGPLNQWANDTLHSREFLENEWVNVQATRQLLVKIECGKAVWSDGEKFWGQIQRVLWLRSLRHAVRFDK
jgi:asparagine synthase (glutamine-hydrolysing)